MSLDRAGRRAWGGLVVVLILTAWWRAHTFAPSLHSAWGLNLWPVLRGETQPLDCDEAAYTLIGQRLLHGEVMYRDLTENKPPGGYWTYALAVALGGAREITVRVLPLPLVLATVALSGAIALRLSGPVAAIVAAVLCAIVSTDPYLYGNTAQFEQAMNLFSTAALYALVRGLEPQTRRRGAWLLIAGATLGGAVLIKQVAGLSVVLFALLLATGRAGGSHGDRGRGPLAFLGGFALAGGIAVAVLAFQNALGPAWADVVRYGGALAALPAEPNAPPLLVRWVTGNADPQGNLPPPFGPSTYLVWWGTGSWPFWLAALGAMVSLLLVSPRTTGRLCVVAACASAIAQTALPRLFWPHYYLLPVPALAIAAGIALGDAIRKSRRQPRSPCAVLGGLALVVGLVSTVGIQARSYLLIPADQLGARYQGGAQWLFLREMGRELAERTHTWREPTLFVWGIQTPLHIYGRLGGVTAQVFTDNLIRDRAGRGDRFIDARTDRILRELQSHPPDLVFAGYPPFPGLRAYLQRAYLPAPLTVRGHPLPSLGRGMGLWARADRLADLEAGARP